MKRIAVIGGGPAGCSAAYHLQKRGCQVSLFERNRALGGRTFTNRSLGIPTDTGAGFFTNFYPLLQSLVQDLGLQDQVQPLFRDSTMIRGDQRATLKIGSALSFLRFPFLSPSEKIGMVKTTLGLTLARGRYDLVDPKKLANFDTETTKQWACRTLGANVYDTVIRPGVESFWYFSCDESSAAMTQALQAQAANASFFSFKNGMDTISHALVAGVHCTLGVAAQFIEPYRDQYSIRLDNKTWADGFDGIVVATTAPLANQLTRKLTDDVIPEPVRRFITDQRYVNHVHAAYRVPEAVCANMGPSVFPCGPGTHLVGAVTRNTAKYQHIRGAPPGEEIVGVYLTQAGSQLMQDYSDAKTYAETWALARRLLPELPADCTPHHLYRRPYAIPIPTVGHYKHAAEIQTIQRGPIVFAGDYLATATVEGALRTGKFAAQRLDETLA